MALAASMAEAGWPERPDQGGERDRPVLSLPPVGVLGLWELAPTGVRPSNR